MSNFNLSRIDERTAKRYKKEYFDQGIEKLLNLNHKGGIPKLTTHQEIELSEYIDNHIGLLINFGKSVEYKRKVLDINT